MQPRLQSVLKHLSPAGRGDVTVISPTQQDDFFLSHNASPVSHTIVVNFLSAPHPVPFFREYDSI